MLLEHILVNHRISHVRKGGNVVRNVALMFRKVLDLEDKSGKELLWSTSDVAVE